MEKLTHQLTVNVNRKLEDAEINKNNTNAKVDSKYDYYSFVNTVVNRGRGAWPCENKSGLFLS